MIAANIDVAFIVQACGFDFNPARLDRYLVMADEGAIEPWIILTKTDLIPPGQLDAAIGQVRCAGRSARILPLSNVTHVGLHALRALLAPGRTYCLLGSSGVGKTTLVNRLLGSDALATKAVSDTGEGVHTTVRRQLLMLDHGAMLIDTPGMRELGLLGTGDSVDDVFAEIRDLALNCRFTDCTHTAEPGCAVLLAMKNGTLSAERYRSYIKLRNETEYHDLSYFEKRRADKSFGRLVKAAKKSMRDWARATA